MIYHCILHISLKHELEDCRSTILSLARNPIQIWSNFIQLYPSLFSNILMYMEKLILMDIAQKIIWNTYVKPRNSCVHTYIMNPYECVKNINILMKNTTTFWCSSWRTQQHSDGQNVHPEIQVKVCGAQDMWHNTIGHPTKDQHYLHHCKSFLKHLKSVWSSCILNWSSLKALSTFFIV